MHPSVSSVFLHHKREFRIRAVCYVNYRVVLVGEKAIRFLSNLAQKSIVSYPKFT